jgi:hypothetical protein
MTLNIVQTSNGDMVTFPRKLLNLDEPDSARGTGSSMETCSARTKIANIHQITANQIVHLRCRCDITRFAMGYEELVKLTHFFLCSTWLSRPIFSHSLISEMRNPADHQVSYLWVPFELK